MESEKRFPVDAKYYNLCEEVGDGVSATVYRALCIPLNEVVAIKVLDLEKCNSNLDNIRREVHTMSLIDHPNVLRAHCSFTTGQNLWVVMPYMSGGSCLHIMKSSFPEGFGEIVIATLLREVLKALVYLHSHGHIHRDVKAGNILIDYNGAVKLADFGVSASMFDSGDRQRSRITFVGTPCWMAPEVMQQLHGYDFKADIWSLGITALELAHGHAPFSKYPPMKVLLMTLQNAPPGLDYERDRKFSKSFKDLVATCLVKDPKKRPTSENLLKHQFFRQAKSVDYLARSILEGLAPLGERYRMLKAKEADLLMQNKALYEDKEQLSQQEYIRGISAWNFNLEDLKYEAALIPDYDEISNSEDLEVINKQRNGCDDVGLSAEVLSPNRANSSTTELNQEDELNDLHDLERRLASFPMKPFHALKGCFDVGEDDENASSPSWKGSTRSDSEQQLITKSGNGTIEVENMDWDLPQTKYETERNHSGTLLYRQRRDFPSAEDTSEGAVVQRKGRFKVTSADLSPKCPVNSMFRAAGEGSPASLNLAAASILPSLHSILQQNAIQREEIIKLIKYFEQPSVNQVGAIDAGTEYVSQLLSNPRERDLQSQVSQLQQSIGSLVEELRKQKVKNSQLEKHLDGLTEKKDSENEA